MREQTQITPERAVDEIEHHVHHTAKLLETALRAVLDAPTSPGMETIAVLLTATEDRAKRLAEAVTDAHRSMGRAG